jgi:hypothetical protein
MSRTIGAYIRRHHLGLIAIFVALGGTAIAANQPGSDGDFDACFEKKTGDLDLLKKKKCDRGEKAVSWGGEGEQGPQGPQGPAGADGADGAPGSAIAFGRINADGSLSHATGITGVSTPQTGIYCVSVPGADPAQRAMIVGVEYNGAAFQNGSAHWTATDNMADDPMSGGGQFPIAQWDSIPNFCAAGSYEIRTNRYIVDAVGNDLDIEPSNTSFSLVVP